MSQKFTKKVGLIALTGLSAFLSGQSQQSFNWGSAGPIFTAGRSRNIVVDKNDPSGNTLYTGSASSGVFYTTNGGVKWSPLDDQGTVRNISYMAQAADGTIFAATGEGFLRKGQMAKAQVGTGLYRVDLATKTLIQVAPSSMVGTIINRVACSPSNGNIIAVAGNMGILISQNGAAGPFNVVIPGGSGISGQDLKFDNNGNLYCSVGNEKLGNPSPSTQIYKITGNTNAAAITPSNSILGTPNYGRIELAIAPSNNNVIYASIANKASDPVGFTSSLKALFVSYDAGSTWALLKQGSPPIDPLTDGVSIASGDYAHVMTVNPSDPDQIFIAGYRLFYFKRTNGSNTNPIGQWIPIGIQVAAFISQYYLHENIHDIKVVGSGTSAKFYFVTDGGIFRSVDLASASVDLSIPPSFQPFYKGLVTGQFNSVSIQSFPTSANSATAVSGEAIQSNYAFLGGTGGNGLTYYNGIDTLATQETNFLAGEIYNSEFSKILPNAGFCTASFIQGVTGGVYRISDVKTAVPALVSVNTFTGTLAKITPVTFDFANEATNTYGTPFKLWENYGQIKRTPDSLVFYNDSLRVQANILGGLATLTTQSTFTFSVGRPNKFAKIDSIAVRTGTVVYDLNASQLPASSPFQGTDKKDIMIKLAPNYTVSPTITTPSISLKTGPVSAAGVTLDATSDLDDISVTFTAPPFQSKTTFSYTGSADPSVYYKVFATIFYKYAVGDSITITDNSISTKPQKYSFTLTTPLHWSANSANGPKPIPPVTNPVQKIATRMSARLATVYKSNNITGGKNAVVVSKAPLSLNDPLTFVRVSADGALTTDANGVPTNSPIAIPGMPIILEWSKAGTELYYATDDNKLYRVSNLVTILDLLPSSYSGKLSTDIFKYASPPTSIVNPNSPYRTTLLATFTKSITSIALSKNDSLMVVTFNDPTGTLVMCNTKDIRKSDYTNVGFTNRSGTATGLSNAATYCSLFEKDDFKKVFVGTDNGLYYTADVTSGSPSWTKINNGQLPNVQIFDIKQQTLEPWNCYNSGEIFVATNGRGVWANRSFFVPYTVSIKEFSGFGKGENNLSIFPNPTNGSASLSFNSVDGESATLNLTDINGRLIKTENLGKLNNGQATYSFETSDLNSGMYIVSVSSNSGIKRVAKLIVTK